MSRKALTERRPRSNNTGRYAGAQYGSVNGQGHKQLSLGSSTRGYLAAGSVSGTARRNRAPRTYSRNAPASPFYGSRQMDWNQAAQTAQRYAPQARQYLSNV